MNTHRTQLTLFVDEAESAAIEHIRSRFNPVQYGLIKSHVTLCREEELPPVEKLLQILATLHQPAISIDFGPATRFANGKGVLLPATGGNEPFQQLRAAVLMGVTARPRPHEAHITLLHPRNATCTHEIFEQISALTLPHRLTFNKISLIQQEDGKEWEVLKMVALKNRMS
jgi:2'-5' RNA ligase